MFLGVIFLGIICFLMWLKKRNLKKRDEAIDRMMSEKFSEIFSDIERIENKQDDGKGQGKEAKGTTRRDAGRWPG